MKTKNRTSQHTLKRKQQREKTRLRLLREKKRKQNEQKRSLAPEISESETESLYELFGGSLENETDSGKLYEVNEQNVEENFNGQQRKQTSAEEFNDSFIGN